MSRTLLVPALATLIAVACAAPEPAAEAPEPAAQAAEPAAETSAMPAGWTDLVPNAAMPFDGVLVGGQPDDAQLAALRDAGFATVINLRTPEEPGTVEEGEKVGRLGMDYVTLPLAGDEGLTEERARAFAAALDAADKPVVIHCASGNRVGALFALRSFYLEGASADEALELGKEAGLTRMEDAVRRKLQEAGGS